MTVTYRAGAVTSVEPRAEDEHGRRLETALPDPRPGYHPILKRGPPVGRSLRLCRGPCAHAPRALGRPAVAGPGRRGGEGPAPLRRLPRQPPALARGGRRNSRCDPPRTASVGQGLAGPGPLAGSRAAAKRLVGAWKSGENVVTFLPDGTGTNADGSRFGWRLREDFLLVRPLSKDGKPGHVEPGAAPLRPRREGDTRRCSKRANDEPRSPGSARTEARRGAAKEGRSYPKAVVPEEEDKRPRAAQRAGGAASASARTCR